MARGSGGESASVELEGEEAPGVAAEGLEVETDGVLDETLLRLEVLWGEEGAFGPDDGLKLAHELGLLVTGTSLILPGAEVSVV